VIGVSGTGLHAGGIGGILVGSGYLSAGFLVVSKIMLEDLIYANFVFVQCRLFLSKEVR
jgi:hypothetical protein